MAAEESQWKLPSDDVDLRGITKLGQELLAVFPGEAESAHVGDADPGHDVANGRKIVWIEFAVHECRFMLSPQCEARLGG